MKNFFPLFLSLFSLLFFGVEAKEIVVTSAEGENYVLEVEPNTPFLDVVEHIQNYLITTDSLELDDDKEISFSYTIGVPGLFARKAKPKTSRNYGAPVSPAEKENIRLIIRSLAKYNWAQLAKEESTLKRAGDKINHIHPLRFLQTVFSDEELKVGLFVIRNKSLVWGEYYDGIKSSLNEESDANNLVQFLPDFANNLGINIHTILPYAQTRQWSTVIDILLNSIPRQGNPDRYDM